NEHIWRVTARPSFATPASSASKALSRHVSCMTKGEPATVSATNSPDVSIARLITNRQLIAASDWLHASVISAHRHCPAPPASLPELITVVVSVVNESRHPGTHQSTPPPAGPMD